MKTSSCFAILYLCVHDVTCFVQEADAYGARCIKFQNKRKFAQVHYYIILPSWPNVVSLCPCTAHMIDSKFSCRLLSLKCMHMHKDSSYTSCTCISKHRSKFLITYIHIHMYLVLPFTKRHHCKSNLHVLYHIPNKQDDLSIYKYCT